MICVSFHTKVIACSCLRKCEGFSTNGEETTAIVAGVVLPLLALMPGLPVKRVDIFHEIHSFLR